MNAVSFLAALTAAISVSGAAMAQAADVTVVLGPRLERKADDLGRDEVMRQAQRLEERVERALAARGALPGARIELVLNDVTPNRPTFQQIGDQPGLSYFHSFGIGGAAIEGQIVTADGQSRPVRYDWYSPNIRDSRYNATWQDADRAFMNFSNRLANGRL